MLSTQVARPVQAVLPSTQKPVLSVMEAQTQEPPGPQGPKVSQVWPLQELKEQAPLVQPPDGHCDFRPSIHILKTHMGRRGFW